MKDHLAADLRRSYEGDAWHGPSVLDAIRDITAKEAAARPVGKAHTICELTHHIGAWIGEATSRLQGNAPGSPQDGDFPPPGTKVDDAAWAEVCSRLERRHAELMETLSGFDESRLDGPVDPKNRNEESGPVSYCALISGVTQHNTYHAGQIMLLRKALIPSE